jgi:hypothetical protein
MISETMGEGEGRGRGGVTVVTSGGVPFVGPGG